MNDATRTGAATVGRLRYFQGLGQSYADMFRGSLTASGIVTAGAAWLGMGKTGAVLLGAGSILFWQVLALGFGYLVWRWRVVHATMDHDWRNNPWNSRVVDLLEEIRDRMGRRR